MNKAETQRHSEHITSARRKHLIGDRINHAHLEAAKKARETKAKDLAKKQKLKAREAAKAQKKKAKALRRANIQPEESAVSERTPRSSSGQRTTKHLGGQRVATERTELQMAHARVEQCEQSVERSQNVVAYLSRGRAPPDTLAWLNSFKQRHGRPPTEDELADFSSRLDEEKLNLRVHRHELAEALLRALEAERLLLLKEQTLATKAIKQWERELRKITGAIPGANERAANSMYQTLMRGLDENAREIAQLERRAKAARDREIAWPGMHWQRSDLATEIADDEQQARQTASGSDQTAESIISMSRQSSASSSSSSPTGHTRPARQARWSDARYLGKWWVEQEVL